MIGVFFFYIYIYIRALKQMLFNSLKYTLTFRIVYFQNVVIGHVKLFVEYGQKANSFQSIRFFFVAV